MCFINAADASKAFDRLDHSFLLGKLISRNLPDRCIKLISCWYSELYSPVGLSSMNSVLPGVELN